MLPIVKAGEKNPIGVITDRDIVVRVLAAGLDPKNTKACFLSSPAELWLISLSLNSYQVWNVCSQDVCLVDVKDSIDSAVGLMYEIFLSCIVSSRRE
jgi:predicted transcriptional regulator